MRTNDIQTELGDGIELAPVPAGPDGSIRLPMMRPATPPPPRLCEQGPCVHYHQFTIQLDAERARAAAVAGQGPQHGRLVGGGSEAFHTEVHHYCYPESGVDTILGSLPVIQCNRWRPKTIVQRMDEGRAGDDFLDSEDGKRYLAEREAWEAARAAEQSAQESDETEANRLIAEMSLQITEPTP